MKVRYSVLFGLMLTSHVSAAELACPSLTHDSNGSKVCDYNPSKASDYAVRNYRESSQNDNRFSVYSNNCTNFVSQSVMAGFAETKYRSTLYSKRQQYLSDQNDTYSWFYRSTWDTGNNWKEAHSLYLYAKYTDENDNWYNYQDNGPKFEFVDRDSHSEYLDPDLVQKGDIIFVDAHNPAYGQYVDGKMDHVFLVTDKVWWRPFYDEIRVTSNSSYYKNKGLGTINNAYNQNVHFYVYRPTAYVQK